MAGKPFFAPVPNPPPDYNVEWGNRVVTSLNVAMAKVNNGATITLADGVDFTIMYDARLSGFSVLNFMPTTANAAVIWGSIYVTDRAKGQAVIHHANTVETDQTFEVSIHA